MDAMELLFPVLLTLGLLVVAGTAYVYNRFSQKDFGLPSSALPPVEGETEIDRRALPLLKAQDGMTGATLISDNVDAFAARAISARQAGRSLDLQYYYWRRDLTDICWRRR